MLKVRNSLTALALVLGTSAGVSVIAHADPILEAETEEFLAGLAGAPPIYTLTPEAARDVLVSVQSGPVSAPAVDIEDRVLAIGPTGSTKIRVYRPKGMDGVLPGIVYFHGAGWVMGDTVTHDRLVREIADGAQAAVVFVDYERSPEHRFPTAIEQDYAVTDYVARNAAEFGIDPARIAVGGDSVGGNMAAVITLLAKERQGPDLAGQLLFYPVTDAGMDTGSYTEFANGPWLTKPAMAWFWDAYLTDEKKREHRYVSPLNASLDQLSDLPRALVITAENDVLRDEGEAYAEKLTQAGVTVTSTRYNETIHDFVMLNALSETPATRAAIDQATAFLKTVFEIPVGN